MDTYVFDGFWSFSSPPDREQARKNAAKAFSSVRTAFESNDYLFDCPSISCGGADYGWAEPLGDKTVHRCPSAIGEKSGDAPPTNLEDATMTILHEFFHVVRYAHPEAEDFAKIAWDLRFKTEPKKIKIDTAGG
jgi:hypothetical protein